MRESLATVWDATFEGSIRCPKPKCFHTLARADDGNELWCPNCGTAFYAPTVKLAERPRKIHEDFGSFHKDLINYPEYHSKVTSHYSAEFISDAKALLKATWEEALKK